MRKSVISIWVTCVVLTSPLQAQMATIDDALTVANNWMRLIIRQEGNWGGSDTAEVIEIQEFTREQRVIGYFCRVSPNGYILVSLRRELAPVKAYSTTCDLDAASEEGMSDLMKGKMARILDSVEPSADGVRLAQARDISSLLEIDYRPAWRALGSRAPGSSGSRKLKQHASTDPPIYRGGMAPLLSSRWHQGDPYNYLCPASNVTCDGGYSRCCVGCGPLACAQVMRYWAWPPWYDWANMPDSIQWNYDTGGYYTEDGRPATQTQIDAVAELCHAVGLAADADYCCGKSGPCSTSTTGGDLLDAFEDDWRFNDAANNHERVDYDSLPWFNMIVAQLNKNRPIPYTVGHSSDVVHAVVCDGWQEYTCGGTYVRQYHVNYGWASMLGDPDCDDWDRYGSSNAWVTMDELPCSNPGEEEMLLSVYPGPSTGKWLSDHEVYPKKSFNYRYFDQDATGPEAIFEPGQNLQFLSGVKVTRSGDASGGPIQFLGLSSDKTRLFSIKGTPSGGVVAGIQINSGAVELHQNGSVRFHAKGPENSNVDLCDLGEAYRDFEPRTLSYYTQPQPFTIWSILSNKGTVDSGPFKIRFYASVDTIIAEGDHVLGEADVRSLAPAEIFSFRWDELLFMAAKGTYYVGWIIDADDEIGETNELNNAAYKEGYRLVVQ